MSQIMFIVDELVHACTYANFLPKEDIHKASSQVDEILS